MKSNVKFLAIAMFIVLLQACEKNKTFNQKEYSAESEAVSNTKNALLAVDSTSTKIEYGKEKDKNRILYRTYEYKAIANNLNSATNEIENTTIASGGFVNNSYLTTQNIDQEENIESDSIYTITKYKEIATMEIKIPEGKINDIISILNKNSIRILSKKYTTEDLTNQNSNSQYMPDNTVEESNTEDEYFNTNSMSRSEKLYNRNFIICDIELETNPLIQKTAIVNLQNPVSFKDKFVKSIQYNFKNFSNFIIFISQNLFIIGLVILVVFYIKDKKFKKQKQ